ncbi:MAG TPA: STAS domain-containing protein, partial [Nannocystis exedens]|nr:STAS domain-containing protein [Nannocystis exedens]
QQRHIEELATPVLRLWKGVLAVPLIGRVEAWRAAQLMDALLAAIQREKASVVVIDITGVTQVDADVAKRLLKTAHAARLVGARCMLVGIRAEVARTIVESGIDIDDVQIYSTLEQALARIIDREKAESAPSSS